MDIATVPRRPRAFALPSNWGDYVLYAGWHLSCLSVFWVGVSWKALAICAVSYFIRMFGLIAGHHRYFSHRSYTLSRPMQFLMALLGTTGGQRGLLWWVASHRYHHLHSDMEDDVHSPVMQSVLYAHSGWFLDPKQRQTKLDQVPDLAKFPELVWLSDWAVIPVLLYGAGMWLLFGLQGFVWGFLVATILVWHGVHTLSSFAHTPGGSRRYPTADYSRNKWSLALVTLGDAWHNNHHYYPAAARHGFFWWEIDLTWYGLKILSWLGIVRDLRLAPEHIIRGELPGFQRRVTKYEADVADVRLQIKESVESTAVKQRIEERFDVFMAEPTKVFIEAPDDRMRMFYDLRRDVLAAAVEEPEGVRELLERELDRILESPPFFEVREVLPKPEGAAA